MKKQKPIILTRFLVIIVAALALIFCLVFAGCKDNQKEIDNLYNKIADLQEQLDELRASNANSATIYIEGDTVPLRSNDAVIAEITFAGWDNIKQVEVFYVKNVSPVPLSLGDIAFVGISYLEGEYFEFFTQSLAGIVITPNETVEFSPPNISSSNYQYIGVGFYTANKGYIPSIFFSL